MERPVGVKILEFFTETPLGEEIIEGTMGGTLAGLSQIGSDKSAGQIGLETAMAILGGIGVGKLGRHVGAWAGKRAHAAPLKDQAGMLAMVGRLGGSETIGKGLKESAVMGREAVKESLINETSIKMAREAAADPAGFVGKYGITPEQFQSTIGGVQAGRTGAAALKTLENMPPAQREAILKSLAEEMGGYEAVENALKRAAYNDFDANVQKAVDNREKIGEFVSDAFGGGKEKYGIGDYLGERASRALADMSNPVTPVTGEHIGKAIGRFIGDEVGILGGMAAGGAIAQQMGIESPKDRKIRELERQLAGRSQ